MSHPDKPYRSEEISPPERGTHLQQMYNDDTSRADYIQAYLGDQQDPRLSRKSSCHFLLRLLPFNWVGTEILTDHMTRIISESYLIFVIFLHEQNFWRIKFTTKKCVSYGKIDSKLPIFCVITTKYTENCQSMQMT